MHMRRCGGFSAALEPATAHWCFCACQSATYIRRRYSVLSCPVLPPLSHCIASHRIASHPPAAAAAAGAFPLSLTRCVTKISHTDLYISSQSCPTCSTLKSHLRLNLGVLKSWRIHFVDAALTARTACTSSSLCVAAHIHPPPAWPHVQRVNKWWCIFTLKQVSATPSPCHGRLSTHSESTQHPFDHPCPCLPFRSTLLLLSIFRHGDGEAKGECHTFCPCATPATHSATRSEYPLSNPTRCACACPWH
ncbi:hypothetical protein BKA81DRAFT_207341 [Phyllosticta paracitricarpa]